MNDTEVMPSLGQFFSAVLNALQWLPERLLSQLSRTNTRGNDVISLNAVYVVSTLTLVLALARGILVRKVTLAICARFKLRSDTQAKLEESVWKFVFYLLSTLWTFYLTAVQNNFFQQPSKTLLDWNPNLSLHWSFQVLYAVEISFYIHGTYTILFVDVWKKDSGVLICHHIITLLLMGLSYMDRAIYIGSLVILFHDSNDILLELGKIFNYLKNQNGKFIQKLDLAANISFFFFTISWFSSRLYYYPLKVIYTATMGMKPGSFQEMRFSASCFILLLIILVMNSIWSVLVCTFWFRLITGQTKEFCDLREYEEEEQVKSVHKNGKKIE